VHGFCCHMD